jgi:hypothetical protein
LRPRLLLEITVSLAVAMCAQHAGAQDAASAKTFLAAIYQRYGRNGKGISQSGREAQKYFHSSLIALMQADVKAVGSDIPIAMDADLMCDCQDWDGIYDLKIDVHPQSGGQAVADISFALSDPKTRDKDSWRKLKVTLASEHAEWRIYDIVSYSGRDVPSDLRAEIKREIQSYARDSNMKGAR